MLHNNAGKRNHWIGINPRGTRSNRDGIGCRLKIVGASGLAQYFTVNTAGSYLSASDRRVLAGLGADETVKLIEARWPSGAVQRMENVKAGQWLKPGRANFPCRVRSRQVNVSRRALLAALSTPLFGQGIASRGVAPTAARKALGHSISCALYRCRGRSRTDASPVIYGDAAKASYIVETTGCGVAFFDYDNDGWLDILVLNGSRLDGRAGRNVEPALPEQSRRNLHRRHRRKPGLSRSGWASAVTVGDYNNDGFDDLFITYCGQNVLYRNNGDGTFTDVTKEAGLLAQQGPLGLRLHLRRLRSRRPPGPVRRQLPRVRYERTRRNRATRVTAL